MKFDDLEATLTGRCSQRRKVANNTWLERRSDDVLAIRLHQTDVVKFYRNGNIVLDSGGWMTVTTKERMNRYIPGGIGSERGRWYYYPDVPIVKENRVAYVDGMTITADGKAQGLDAFIAAAEDTQNKKLRRDVDKFVKSITPEQIVAAFNNRDRDCFGCALALTGVPNVGDKCLDRHVLDCHFDLSLALRAVQSRGYRMPGVIMQFIYNDAQSGRVNHALTDNLRKFLLRNLTVGTATR